MDSEDAPDKQEVIEPIKMLTNMAKSAANKMKAAKDRLMILWPGKKKTNENQDEGN